MAGMSMGMAYQRPKASIAWLTTATACSWPEPAKPA